MRRFIRIKSSSPEEVNAVLERFDDETRDKNFVFDDTLHRGFSEIRDNDDIDADDFFPDDFSQSPESQLGFNFDSDNETLPEPKTEDSETESATLPPEFENVTANEISESEELDTIPENFLETVQ
ncbi:MAG: hypothetical protein IJG36_09905 [Synergistaceae bacterium]|nr:hypothetical protein [Synergistaceae bacterium]MBR0278884.1 hypothetical protein [Synergistaceae bacterium]